MCIDPILYINEFYVGQAYFCLNAIQFCVYRFSSNSILLELDFDPSSSLIMIAAWSESIVWFSSLDNSKSLILPINVSVENAKSIKLGVFDLLGV